LIGAMRARNALSFWPHAVAADCAVDSRPGRICVCSFAR
jgi:hypothetical protein